jgi:DASH complex subunit ASK1
MGGYKGWLFFCVSSKIRGFSNQAALVDSYPLQFWKQFFEASANVSLSGYEDLAGADENSAITGDESTIHNQTADYTPRRRSAGDHDVSIATDQSSAMYHGEDTHQEESTLGGDDDDDLTGSTPRPPATKTLSARPQFAGLSSPYEIMKREYDNERRTAAGGAKTPDEPPPGEEEEEDTELLFQQHTARLPNMSMNPRASLDASGLGYDDEEDDEFDPRTGRVNKTNNKDPLLHRMLDKNYRIAATPHKGGAATGVSPIKWKVDKLATTPAGKGKDTHRQARPIWEDSPTSSPEMAVPQLRSAAFMSPARAAYKAKGKGKASAAAPVVTGPRTPGVSVQTPATGRKTKDVFANAGKQQGAASSRYDDEITWDSDSDGFGGMSPPKTIQFAMPPSKLLQTPGMYLAPL